MKLTGKEKARLCIEVDNKEDWTNKNFTIKELLDSFILGTIATPIKNKDKVDCHYFLWSRKGKKKRSYIHFSCKI